MLTQLCVIRNLWYIIHRKTIMKRFYETNTITYNIMSFSAFKAIMIFSACLEGPKSYKELQDILANHEYIKEIVSYDTIRIYINSLKKIGCDITKINKNRVAKYYINKHPFELKINETQVTSIIKVFRAISKNIALDDFMAITDFFKKFSMYVINEELKNELQNISPLNNINKELIQQLNKYAHDNSEIVFLYNSPNTGMKEIYIIADKLYIEDSKLYLAGYSNEHNNYAKFLVSKIKKIIQVNIRKTITNFPEITVTYEYEKHDNNTLNLLPNEKIINETNKNITIEIRSKNKFDIMQRMLFHGDKCTVLSPSDFREEIITCLKKMKEGYFGIQ